MDAREKIINAIEKAKKQSEEYAQDRIIVPFKEADMILALLKEQEAVKPLHKCIGNEFSRIASDIIEDAHYDYCPYCGKPITWESR